MLPPAEKTLMSPGKSRSSRPGVALCTMARVSCSRSCGQPQARHRIAIDVETGGAARGREALVAETRASRLGDRCDDLEVEQADRVVLTDHHVEQVQIAINISALMDGTDRLFDLAINIEGPGGEALEILGR